MVRVNYKEGAVSEDTYDYVKYMSSVSTVFLPTLLAAGVFSGLITVAVNLLLLYGVLRKRRGHMMPWIVIVFICLALKTVAGFAYAIVNMAYVDVKFGFVALMVFIPTVALSFYVWLCVLSHYKELKLIKTFSGEMRKLQVDEETSGKKNKMKCVEKKPITDLVDEVKLPEKELEKY
jgi:hypothetical protein